MNKIISIVLLCSVLLICFSGCSIPNDPNGEKGSEQGGAPSINEDKENTTMVIIDGEIDKSSDLVVTLVAYLEQYLIDYDLMSRTFSQKVDDIKNGIQPLHVAFDPAKYYFVCGYYDPAEEHNELVYCCAGNYTWVGYKSEADLQE